MSPNVDDVDEMEPRTRLPRTVRDHAQAGTSECQLPFLVALSNPGHEFWIEPESHRFPLFPFLFRI